MVLKNILETKKERNTTYWTRQLMSGKDIDQRQLDFSRGFWAGVDYLIANPENAEKTFEIAMKRAQVLDEGSDS